MRYCYRYLRVGRYKILLLLCYVIILLGVLVWIIIGRGRMRERDYYLLLFSILLCVQRACHAMYTETSRTRVFISI